MIEFALMIAEYMSGRKRRRGGAASLPTNHREIAAEALVVECPYCNSVSLCNHFILEEAADYHSPFRPVNEIFICAQCRQILETEDFENDGTGVMRAKRWTCPQCGVRNLAAHFNCSKCHAWRAGKTEPAS